MNGIEKYYDINISELSARDLFFSVVSKCKEKNILDSTELAYVDSQLNLMIEETARFCGKGYIKEEAARIMLKNIFMILDSVYSVSDYQEIIRCIKDKKLSEMWQRGLRESIAAFDRTKKNFYHLEHFYYKNPDLRADFAINLKNDYAFSNIYTHSFETARFTKAFFAISEKENFRVVRDRSEMLCAECAIFEKLSYSDIRPMVEYRGLFRVDGGVKYTSLMLDAILISMCYSAFYRCDGIFPTAELANDILSELVKDDTAELEDNFNTYLQMVIGRYGPDIVEKEKSYGENILNVYASRLSDENIKLLARYLVSVVSSGRVTEKGLKNLIHFV